MIRYAIAGDSHASVYGNAARMIAPDFLCGGGLGGAMQLWEPFFHVDECFRFTGSSALYYEKWQFKAGARTDHFTNRLIVCLGLAPCPFFGHYQTWFKRHSIDPNAERRFVSAGLLEATAEALQAEAIKFYEACLERQLLLAAILPPPPTRTHRCNVAFGSEFIRGLSEIYTRPVLRWLERNKVPIIDPGLGDETGFMAPQYERADDSDHASLSCGPAVLAAIRASVKDTGRVGRLSELQTLAPHEQAYRAALLKS